MSERGEQQTLAQWLDFIGVCWFHVPNENQYKHCRIGVKGGVPDIIIIDPPPACDGKIGCVIEMKWGKNKPSKRQRQWINNFESRRWLANVCYSFEEAKDWLIKLGYGHEF